VTTQNNGRNTIFFIGPPVILLLERDSVRRL
jgi:hypothetical protein